MRFWMFFKTLGIIQNMVGNMNLKNELHATTTICWISRCMTVKKIMCVTVRGSGIKVFLRSIAHAECRGFSFDLHLSEIFN